jgi:GT2 family glycosyltransferase
MNAHRQPETNTARPVVHPVSLIVCSRNRLEMLRDTIESVLGGSAIPAEIIVVDQSDVPDPGIESAAGGTGCELRYHWTDERGLSRANNLGTALASHDIVAFMHDDVFVEADWFAQLIRALHAAPEQSVVTGRVIPTPPEVPGGFAPTLIVDTTAAVYSGRVGKDVLKPFNVALHRQALNEVGGFDPRLGPGTPFPGAEDSDLGFRLLEAGYRILYVPGATVNHRAWRLAEDYLPLRWGYGVAQGAFFAKHLNPRDPYMLRRMARDWLRRTARFPLRLVREGRRGFGDPLFIGGNVVGMLRWYKMHGYAASEQTHLASAPSPALHAR